jgi:hypothetical protein
MTFRRLFGVAVIVLVLGCAGYGIYLVAGVRGDQRSFFGYTWCLGLSRDRICPVLPNESVYEPSEVSEQMFSSKQRTIRLWPIDAEFKVPQRAIERLIARKWLPDLANNWDQIQLAFLLPKLSFRNQSNSPNFGGRYPEILRIQFGGQTLGQSAPDYWYRQKAIQDKLVRRPQHDVRGLEAYQFQRSDPSLEPYEVIFSAKDSVLNPDGTAPIVVCSPIPASQDYNSGTCEAKLKVPRSIWPEEIQSRFQRLPSGEVGIILRYMFPRSRLENWTEVHRATLCIIEAASIGVSKIPYEGRNEALCKEVHLHLVDGSDELLN